MLDRAPAGRFGVISPWFVVTTEGGMWSFLADEDEWNANHSSIKGRRIGDRMVIDDAIANCRREYLVTERQLLDLGYRRPKSVPVPDSIFG